MLWANSGPKAQFLAAEPTPTYPNFLGTDLCLGSDQSDQPAIGRRAFGSLHSWRKVPDAGIRRSVPAPSQVSKS